jgi:hypothetical protein
MAKKRLILTRRRKTEVIDEDIATSENPQAESDAITDSREIEIDIPIENTITKPESIENTITNPEIKVVNPQEILPVLEIQGIVDIPNSILNSSDEPVTDQISTLCKFNKVVEPLDISLNSVEVLPDPVSDFNDSIRKLMLDRNDVYKPYIEETMPETTQDETGILPNQKIQDRNDKVKNSSRTMVPTSRRKNPVSNNRTL